MRLQETTSKAQSISGEDIANTVSKMTKIPLTKLAQSEMGRLANLEKTLKMRIVGQDEAVTEVAKTIRRSRAGITDPKRPLGSFIFLGPTGVGKTETAKVIAQEIFEDENALIRVDMSEFMERHNVARLIGAPAGYVGYEEGGRLTEAVRRRPYSVILFDEIEKANPDVFNILLQILEDGQLTDAAGKAVNFRNTIIIMTSNLGMQELTSQATKIGFADRDEQIPQKQKLEREYENIKNGVLDMLKRDLRPEFLNRIDKVIVYRPLAFEQLKKITSLQIGYLQDRLADQKITLKVTAPVAKFIAEQSFDPAQGARFIRRNVQNLLEDPLAELIIGKGVTPGSMLTADLKKDGIAFQVSKSKEKILQPA
jgi:ATP-dependent Clp protease ATP-binding subunit ClpC